MVNPIALLDEIEKLKKLGLKINPKNLIVSENATIIFSFHRNIDKIREERKGPNKIGTTGRGIGPAYEDKVGRRAIRFGDLKNNKVLNEKVKNILDYHNIILSGLKSKLLVIHLMKLLKKLIILKKK